MTQITEYKPLDDGDFECDAWICLKKGHNHKGHFFNGHGEMFYRENMIFAPFFKLFAPFFNLYAPLF